MAFGLNGSTQFLTVPVNAALEFGTGDFTVTCKTQFNNAGSSQPMLCLGRGVNTGIYCGWLLIYVPSRLYWYRWTPTETSADVAWSPASNTPYSMTVTRSSGTLKLYVDTTELLSVSNSTSYDRINNDNFYIGRQESGVGTRFLGGSISEAAIWKGAGLTAAEVEALSKGFTADQIRPQNLSFYAPMVSELRDLRGGLTITNNNSATVAVHPRIIT